MGEYFVYVVANDTARQHKVTIGPSIGTDVIIFSGLEPGEKIVTEGIQKLKDGSAVMLGDPQQQAPGQAGGKAPQNGPGK